MGIKASKNHKRKVTDKQINTWTSDPYSRGVGVYQKGKKLEVSSDNTQTEVIKKYPQKYDDRGLSTDLQGNRGAKEITKDFKKDGRTGTGEVELSDSPTDILGAAAGLYHLTKGGLKLATKLPNAINKLSSKHLSNANSSKSIYNQENSIHLNLDSPELINIGRSSPKVKKNIYKATLKEGNLEIKKRGGSPENPKSIIVRTNSGDIHAMQNEDGSYMFHNRVDSRIDAGKAMLKLNEHLPKKPIIHETSSMSADSYTNLLKIGKNKDWKASFAGRVPLNDANKNVNFLDDLFKWKNKGANAAFPSEKNALEAQRRMTDYLNKHGYNESPNIFEKYGEWQMEIPNYRVQRNYQKGAKLLNNKDTEMKEKGGSILGKPSTQSLDYHYDSKNYDSYKRPAIKAVAKNRIWNGGNNHSKPFPVDTTFFYKDGGDINKLGYKDISPYKNRESIDIQSNNITMKGVSKDLIGTGYDAKNNPITSILMKAGKASYQFPPNVAFVREKPFKAQIGAKLPNFISTDVKNLKPIRANYLDHGLIDPTNRNKINAGIDYTPGLFKNKGFSQKQIQFKEDSSFLDKYNRFNSIQSDKTRDSLFLNRTRGVDRPDFIPVKPDSNPKNTQYVNKGIIATRQKGGNISQGMGGDEQEEQAIREEFLQLLQENGIDSQEKLAKIPKDKLQEMYLKFKEERGSKNKGSNYKNKISPKKQLLAKKGTKLFLNVKMFSYNNGGNLIQLNGKGSAEAVLQGEERIFSIPHTEMIVKKSLESKTEKDAIELGKAMFNILEKQNNQKPEYVTN